MAMVAFTDFAPQLFLRVLTTDGGIWELCRKAAGGDWEVYKRYD